MEIKNVLNECRISTDKSLINFDTVYKFLAEESHWAKNRTREAIQKSIENSLCFGVYHNKQQIGFARVVTDYAVTYYLGDVFIIEAYRGNGLAKMLVDHIVNCEELKGLWGILATSDAHGLYEKCGFKVPENTNLFMCR